MIQSYRELEVWRKSIALVKEVYRAASLFPRQEQYGLTTQLQRSAVSIAANIAEGPARSSTKEFLYHLNVAYGSLAETETHLVIANELQFLPADGLQGLLVHSGEIGKNGQWIDSISKSKIGPC